MISSSGEGKHLGGSGEVLGINSRKETLNSIVKTNKKTKAPPLVCHDPHYQTTGNEEVCVVDSGACDAVITTHAFLNTNCLTTINAAGEADGPTYAYRKQGMDERSHREAVAN